jgi:SAM-dependent methyltransferase
MDQVRGDQGLGREFPEAGIDFEHANAARLYDYFLGGAHHFAVDRELGDRVAAAYPDIRVVARAQRGFVARAVRWCVDEGVRQFLDLGSGIPTAGHVHEIARAVAPETRVAYVDFEPVAVAHSRALLADVEGVSITAADVRDPDSVLTAPTVTEVLDLARPVAVLAVGLLHFFSDADDPAAILAGYRAALAPGSHLVICHTSDDQDDPALAERVATATAVYADSATPGHLRDRAQIRALLDGLALVEPGLVDINQWHADDAAAVPPLGSYAAVARIP